MSEIKTLNGFPLADTQAREQIRQVSEEIAELKGGSGSGGTTTETVTKTGDFVTVTPMAGTTMNVVSKITGVNTSFVEANKIALRQINGKNLFDFVDALGGAGKVYESNGLRAVVNADGTITLSGTDTSESGWNDLVTVSLRAADGKRMVYPAGTYTLSEQLGVFLTKPAEFLPSIGKKFGTFTVDEPFVIADIAYSFAKGTTINTTVPMMMVAGTALPSSDFAFSGEIHKATFTNKISDGEFNWQTGELKDADGNIIETVTPFDAFPVLEGANTFFTGVGESTVAYKVQGNGSVDVVGETFDPEEWGLPVLALDGNCTGMTKDDYVPLSVTFQDKNGSAIREEVNVKKQGSSSVTTGVEIGGAFDTDVGGLFNFTLKFSNAFEAKEGWGAHKKYVFKADAIDHSHLRNIGSYILWGQAVKSRANVPAELANLPNGGAPDGFPVIVVLNGKFYAVGNFTIPKDGWMFESANHAPKAIVCANHHTDATKFKALAKLDESDFELEYVEDEDNADWVLPSLNRAIQAVMNSDGSDIDTVIGQYIDIPSAIDYYNQIVNENADDAVDKNYILVTFDGVKWYFSAYDRDTVYGLHWNGKTFNSPAEGISYSSCAFAHALMNLLYTHKRTELKARAVELRDGVMSEANVANVFTNYAAGFPSAVLAKNTERWPLLRSTNASNLAQILNWYRVRRQILDKEIDGWN